MTCIVFCEGRLYGLLCRYGWVSLAAFALRWGIRIPFGWKPHPSRPLFGESVMGSIVGFFFSFSVVRLVVS